jgi:hypothetical protein
MAFNLDAVKGFLKNKWALGGLAVAVGAGGFVLYRKVKSGQSGQDDAASGGGLTTAVGGLYPTGSGIADTTASDIGSQLGYFGTSLQSTLTDFGKTISDALAGVHPTTPTTNPPAAKSGAHPILTEADTNTWAKIAQKLFGDASLAGALKGYNRANTVKAGVNANNKYPTGTAFKTHTVIAVPWNVADLKNYSYVPG